MTGQLSARVCVLPRARVASRRVPTPSVMVRRAKKTFIETILAILLSHRCADSNVRRASHALVLATRRNELRNVSVSTDQVSPMAELTAHTARRLRTRGTYISPEESSVSTKRATHSSLPEHFYSQRKYAVLLRSRGSRRSCWCPTDSCCLCQRTDGYAVSTSLLIALVLMCQISPSHRIHDRALIEPPLCLS